MKIKCECGALIIDQTDLLKHKGYFISDTQWFEFWDAIDQAIEQPNCTQKEKENACMQLRKQNIFKTAWECTECGKLYIDNGRGEMEAYSPDSKKYNKVLGKKG